MVLLERKIRSSKCIKEQVVSLDGFCNTWVYLMNEDLVGIKSKFPVSLFKGWGWMDLRKWAKSFLRWVLTFSVISNILRVSLESCILNGRAFKAAQAVSLKAVTSIGSSFLIAKQVWWKLTYQQKTAYFWGGDIVFLSKSLWKEGKQSHRAQPSIKTH